MANLTYSTFGSFEENIIDVIKLIEKRANGMPPLTTLVLIQTVWSIFHFCPLYRDMGTE